MSNEHINPDELFKLPSFSQAVISTGSKTIHIAGQVAFDEEMNVIGQGNYMAQAAKAFQNVATALEAAGATPEDVVSTVMYVKDLNPKSVEGFGAGMMTALNGKPFPPNASTLIGVAALGHPELLVEISAIAVV